MKKARGFNEVTIYMSLEKTASVFDSPHMEAFIKRRNIVPEDVDLIKPLTALPKDLIVRKFHNFFTGHKERSADELERLIQEEADETAKKTYEIFLILAKKYGWHTCYHLVGVLEGVH